MGYHRHLIKTHFLDLFATADYLRDDPPIDMMHICMRRYKWSLPPYARDLRDTVCDSSSQTSLFVQL